MRLVTILESTTERSASGRSVVCDVELWIWAAKVCTTASGSGSICTDARLWNIFTAKNRAVCYQPRWHTHDLHYWHESTSLDLIYNIISYPETAEESTASCTGVGLASSLKSISAPHDESHPLPLYLDFIIKNWKSDAIIQRWLLLIQLELDYSHWGQFRARFTQE